MRISYLSLPFLALLPGAAFAESDAEEQTNDAIIVEGQRIGDTFTAEEGRTALKMDVPILRTPQAIQIIPREIIDVQAANELSDVLRNVSGITDNNSFGGVQDNFNLRGFNSDNNSTLRDGYLSISDRALNAAVERVEVIKGPSSLLYGRFSPGGLVNVVTKKPLDTFYANASTSHSSRGQSRQIVDITGPVASNVAVRLVGEYENSDAWRNVGHDNKSRFIAPSIRVGDADTSLLVQYEYTDNDQGFDRGQVAFNGKVVDTPATRSLNEAFAFYRQKVHNLGGLFSHKLGETWRIDVKASGQWTRAEDLQVRPRSLIVDAAGNLTGGFRRSVDGNKGTRVRNYYYSANISGKIETGALVHTILIGADHNRQRRTGAYSVDSPQRSDFNIFAPVYGNLDVNLGLLTVTPNSNSITWNRTTGFYAQDLVEIGKQWSLLVGGRYERFRNYSQSGLSRPTDNSSDEAFLPRAAILFQPAENLSLYASYARSFRPNVSIPASAGQPAYGPFPPEKGRGYELGFKAELFSRLNLTLAAFDIEKQNVLRSETDAQGNVVTTASAKVKSQGVEFDIAGEVTPTLSLIASYSYIHIRDPQNVSGDRRVQNVPRDKISFSAVWRPKPVPGLSLGGGIYYYSSRYGGLAGTTSGARRPFYLDPYTTAEVYAGYERSLGRGKPTIYGRLALRNLTNEDFDQMSNGDLRIDPGMPRTLYGTVGIRF